MKKMILCLISIFMIAGATYGQEKETRIRKIVRDFLVDKKELSDKVELNSIVLKVYDFTKKIDILSDERIPIQDSLSCYYIGSLNPHSLSHVMVAKNGNYEIIDMGQNLDDALDQLLKYCKKNEVYDEELLLVMKYVLYQYQGNIDSAGGAPLVKDAAYYRLRDSLRNSKRK